jgi:oligopeptide transport system substrate-binding protein
MTGKCWSIYTVLAAWAVLSLAVAPSAQASTLHRGTSGEPGTIDPQKMNGDWEHIVIEDLFLGLTTDDAHGDAIPGLATSWTVNEDKTRYTFTLRNDVRWSDGKPVTAEDAVLGFRRAVDPKTASPNASLLYIIKNAAAVNTGKLPVDQLAVRAPDAHTVVIDLVSPTPYFLDLLSHPVTYPVPSHVFRAYGEDWIRADHIVTDGPYKFAEWVPQAHIRAVKNPDFYDAKSVSIDEVYYYPTEDRSAALRRFRAGELDINNDVPIDQIAWLKSNMPGELRLAPFLATYYYVYNMSKPPFNDKRVRVALSMLVDRETITDRILRTGDIPAYGVVPPGIANYDGGVKASFAVLDEAERIKRARALLADAGFGSGNPLRVTLRYNTSENHKKVATAISAMWKRAGVQTELLNADVAVHYAALREGDFEVARASWVADYNDPQNFLILLSDKTWTINYSRYLNPIFDRYMIEASKAPDVRARAALLRKAEIAAIEDAPILPIYFYVSKNLVSTHVKGWVDNLENVHPTRFLSLQP